MPHSHVIALLHFDYTCHLPEISATTHLVCYTTVVIRRYYRRAHRLVTSVNILQVYKFEP